MQALKPIWVSRKLIFQQQTAKQKLSGWLRPCINSPNKRNEECSNSAAEGLYPNVQSQAKVSMDFNPCLMWNLFMWRHFLFHNFSQFPQSCCWCRSGGSGLKSHQDFWGRLWVTLGVWSLIPEQPAAWMRAYPQSVSLGQTQSSVWPEFPPAYEQKAETYLASWQPLLKEILGFTWPYSAVQW